MMAFMAIIIVLWPLARPAAAHSQADGADVGFYKEQFQEIERDLARGLMSPEEAEAAKAEAGRRLLQVARKEDVAVSASFSSAPALGRRRAISIIALILIPLCGLIAYMWHGVPDYAERANVQNAHQRQLDEINQEIAKREQYLRQNPNDGQAWEKMAFVYLRMGRVDKAVPAYEKAISLLGESPDRLTGYGEALLGAANRMTEAGPAEVQFAKAKAAFEKAALDPNAARARVYLGLAAEEAGETDKAKEYYRAALKIMPDSAELRERLSALEAPGGASQGAEQPQIGRAEIDAMIENLAARLEQNGGSTKEWTQLVRSYMVQKQNDKAVAALVKARKALAGNAGELAEFNASITALGLDGGK